MSIQEKRNAVAMARLDWVKGVNAPIKETARVALEFLQGDAQWNTTDAASRMASSRPALVLNYTTLFLNRVTSRLRMSTPGVKIIPADGAATQEAAQTFQSILRSISYSSEAENVRLGALEKLVQVGEGYWRIDLDPPVWPATNPTPRLLPVAAWESVYLGPSRMPDRSDIEYAFVQVQMPRDKAETLFGHAAMEAAEDTPFPGLHNTVTVTEYWWQEKTPVIQYFSKLGMMSGQDLKTHNWKVSTDLTSLSPQNWDGECIPVTQVVNTTQGRIFRAYFVGDDVNLCQTEEWPGKYIPIIALLAPEIEVNKKLMRYGLTHYLMSAASVINVAFSGAVEAISATNSVPYLAPAEAIKNYRQDWIEAAQSNISVLRYNHVDATGKPIPPPSRNIVTPQISGFLEMINTSLAYMREYTGEDIARSSGSNPADRRAASDMSLATASLERAYRGAVQHEARVLIDLVAATWTNEMETSALNRDGTRTLISIDPAAEAPLSPVQGEDKKMRFNPAAAQFGVMVEDAPDYKTQREESFALLTDAVKTSPDLMKVAGDLIFDCADFPQADLIAERLRRTMSPQILGPASGDAQKLAEATALLHKADATTAQMQGELEDLRKKLGEKAASSEAAIAIAELKEQSAIYRAETDRMRLLIEVKTAEQQNIRNI